MAFAYHKFPPVRVILDNECAGSPLEQRSGLQQQVVMIVHQRVDVNPGPKALAQFADCSRK